jgi:AsmA protein
MNDPVSVMAPAAPPQKRLPHIAVGVVALLTLCGMAATAAHLLLSAPLLDKDVAGQIRRTTGFATTIGGSTRFHLFPEPHIEIDNVAFSDSAGAVRIDAEALIAYLRLLPLIVGRIEIGNATLYQPDIFVALDRKPTLPESAIGHFAQSASVNSGAGTMLLGRIDIVDGHASLEMRHMQRVGIDNINMSVDWPSPYASAALNGELTLHAVPISVQAWLSQPIELLRGSQSATTLRLQSDVLTLSTSGQISAMPRVQYMGPVTANAASLRELAKVVGYSFPRHGTFADFDLHGDLDFDTASAALTNLHVSLDGNDYDGNFAVENANGLPRFSATLASDFLDLTPFLTGTQQPSSAEEQWNHEAPDLSDLRFADLDLRISASRLRLYDMEIDNAALSLVSKPDLIDLTLAEASANRGAVEGRVSLAAKDKILEFHVIGSGKDIDIAPMVLGLDGNRPLSGSLNASVAFDSTGADLGHLVQGLAGRAEIFVTKGEIRGTDLPATLQGADQKVPGEPIARIDGTTAFDRLSFGLHLTDGVAEIDQGTFSAPSLQLNFAGSSDIKHRSLDLAALGETTVGASRRTETIPLRFRVKGWLDALRFFQGEPNLRLPALPEQNRDLPNDATSYAPPE